MRICKKILVKMVTSRLESTGTQLVSLREETLPAQISLRVPNVPKKVKSALALLELFS
jgi:hypothetical protein